MVFFSYLGRLKRKDTFPKDKQRVVMYTTYQRKNIIKKNRMATNKIYYIYFEMHSAELS